MTDLTVGRAVPLSVDDCPCEGKSVVCAICHLRKKPQGRSAPIEMANSLCDPGCLGYMQEPRAGCLWSNEKCADYGYCCPPASVVNAALAAGASSTEALATFAVQVNTDTIAAQQAVTTEQESEILRLVSDLELQKKLHARELDVQLAVAIWLLAIDPETLIVDFDGGQYLIHSLIETERIALLDFAVRSVAGGTMPRRLCPACLEVKCGTGGMYCAGALKDGEAPGLQVPRRVRSAIEKLVAVKKLAGEDHS